MRLPFTTRRTSTPAKARKRSFGVRELMLLVAVCGLVAWSARVVRDMVSPVHQWARQVRDGAARERHEAAMMLGRLTDAEMPATIPSLTAALADADDRVVVTAARSLGRALGVRLSNADLAPARAAVSALLAARADPRLDVRMEVVGGLAVAAGNNQLGPETTAACTEALADALNDRSDRVRTLAVSALGEGGPTNAARRRKALETALADDPASNVRRAAALSLGQFRSGHDEITLALLRSLDKDEPGVQSACDSGLNRLVDFARGEPPRTAAIVPALIEALSSRERRARAHAAGVLGEIGPPAVVSVPALLELLRDASDPVEPRNNPLLWDPACRAALSLSKIAPGTPRAAEVAAALTAVIRSDAIDRRRLMAAQALAGFGPEFTVPALPLLLTSLNESAAKKESPAARSDRMA